MSIQNTKKHTIPSKSTFLTSQTPLHTLTLSLPSNQIKSLSIYANTNAGELAFEFCKQNNLSFDYLINLTEQITSILTSHNTKTQKHPLQHRNTPCILTNNTISTTTPTKLVDPPLTQSTPLSSTIMTRAKSYNKQLTVSTHSYCNTTPNINNQPTTSQSSPKQSTISSFTRTHPLSKIIKTNSKHKRQHHYIDYPNRPHSQQKISSFNINNIPIKTFNTLQQIEEQNKVIDNKKKDYSRSYIYNTNNNTYLNINYTNHTYSGIKTYSFRPNITPIKPQQNKGNCGNSYMKSFQLYKEPKENKKYKISRSVNRKGKKEKYTLYMPLKERTIHNDKKVNNSIDKVREDALINLFNELKGSRNNNNVLNRESIQLKYIPQSIQKLIEFVIESVINKNEEFCLNHFLEVMDYLFAEMTPESKQFIINSYKNKHEVNASRHNSIVTNNINVINNSCNSNNNSSYFVHNGFVLNTRGDRYNKQIWK